MAAARAVLEKCTMMLLTASKVSADEGGERAPPGVGMNNAKKKSQILRYHDSFLMLNFSLYNIHDL